MRARPTPYCRRLGCLLTAVATFAALLHGGAQAGAGGELFVASSTSTGAVGNAGAHYFRVNTQALSGDGNMVVFESESSNLDPADADPGTDIYVKNLVTGALRLVSRRADGVKGNASSRHPAISGDGTKVAFETDSTNLDPRDTDEHADIYVKDLITGALTLASTDKDGNKSYTGAGGSSLSTDGRKLAFASTGVLDRERLTGGMAIYVKDLVSGAVQLASIGPDGRLAKVGGGHLSGNGSRVVFSTATTLLPADGDNNFDPADNKVDVYVKDLATGGLFLADTTSSGEKADVGAYADGISADGTKVAFSTYSTNLDPRHPPNLYNTYVKDLVSGTLSLVGVSDTGAVVEAGGAILSADGTRVGVESRADIEGTGDDGHADVYVKDLRTGSLTMASVDHSGADTAAYISLVGLSGDGRRVAFMSGSDLTTEDDNQTYDVYVKDISTSPSTTTTTTTWAKDKEKDKGAKDKDKGDKEKDKDSSTTTAPSITTTTAPSSTTTTTTPPAAAIISTYAGNGVTGYSGDGGPAISASLAMDSGFSYCIRAPCSPMDNFLRDSEVALAPDGTLYIADVRNHRVRAVSPSGVIRTVVGTGERSYTGDGGPAAAATLAEPRGLALDAAGNLYIADTANHVVRKVDGTGTISTVAGNGTRGANWIFYTDDGRPATEAALCYPQGLTVDFAGALYIADTCNASVRKVDDRGVISTVLGGPTAIYDPEEADGKPAREVRLRGPGALAFDGAGNLYVGANSPLVKVDTTGTVRVLVNEWAAGLVVDGRGDLFFSATSRGVVAKRDAATGTITVVAGTVNVWGDSGDGGPASQARLQAPTGLALGPSGLYLADAGAQRVRVVR